MLMTTVSHERVFLVNHQTPFRVSASVCNPCVRLHDIPARLKFARKQRGFRTARQLAEAAGVSPSAVSNIEARIRAGTGGVLARLAEVLSVPLRWLRDGEGPEPDWSIPAPAPLSESALILAEIYDSITNPVLKKKAFALLVALDERGQHPDPDVGEPDAPLAPLTPAPSDARSHSN